MGHPIIFWRKSPACHIWSSNRFETNKPSCFNHLEHIFKVFFWKQEVYSEGGIKWMMSTMANSGRVCSEYIPRWFHIFFEFSPQTGGGEMSNLTCAYFSDGWFNHDPSKGWWWFRWWFASVGSRPKIFQSEWGFSPLRRFLVYTNSRWRITTWAKKTYTRKVDVWIWTFSNLAISLIEYEGICTVCTMCLHHSLVLPPDGTVSCLAIELWSFGSFFWKQDIKYHKFILNEPNKQEKLKTTMVFAVLLSFMSLPATHLLVLSFPFFWGVVLWGEVEERYRRSYWPWGARRFGDGSATVGKKSWMKMSRAEWMMCGCAYINTYMPAWSLDVFCCML